MTLKRAVTLFLCALIILYILAGPQLLEHMKHQYEKSQEIERKTAKWTGVITLWDYPRLDTRNGSRFRWIRSKIRQFEKQNPGVYIEFRELDWKEGPNLLKAAAKTGANPDIAPVGSEFFFASGGYLEALDAYLDPADKMDYLRSALDTATCNGKLYGFPWMTTGYTLLLNSDLFSERGISPPENGEWTYEQFVEALKQLTYDTNGKGGPDVFGFNSFIEPGYYNIFGLLLSDGAQVMDRSTGLYTFDNPEAVSGLQKLCDLKHKYKVTHPGFGTMSESEAWSSFLKGQTAVYTAGSWTVPYLRSLQGTGGVNFTVAKFPTGKSDVPLMLSGATCSYAVFRQKDEGKRRACIDFIAFLTSEAFQDELTNFGYFPVRKSGKHLYENDKEMYTIQQSLYFAEPLPQTANWQEIDMVLQARVSEAVNGAKSPEQALVEAARQIRGGTQP